MMITVLKKAKSHKKATNLLVRNSWLQEKTSSTLSGIGRPVGMPGQDDRCLLFRCLMLKEQMTTDSPDELLYIIMLSSSLPRYSRLPANAVYMSVAAQGGCSGTTYIWCKSTLANAYMGHLLKVNLITITINSNELNNDINEQVN